MAAVHKVRDTVRLMGWYRRFGLAEPTVDEQWSYAYAGLWTSWRDTPARLATSC